MQVVHVPGFAAFDGRIVGKVGDADTHFQLLWTGYRVEPRGPPLLRLHRTVHFVLMGFNSLLLLLSHHLIEPLLVLSYPPLLHNSLRRRRLSLLYHLIDALLAILCTS